VFIAINFNIVHAFLYGFKEMVSCVKKTKYLPVVVALFSVVGNLFALQAISMAYVSLVMPIIILSSLMIVIFGGTFFHEKYLSYRIVISVLMILGAYLIII
jgi:drug/metabolite transporter (DMT)-like permease